MKQNTLIESQTKRDKQAYCMKFDFRCRKRQKITNSERQQFQSENAAYIDTK